MFLGANTLECESSRERKIPGQFYSGNESSREREGQEAKRPGSERARERKFHRRELSRVLLADSLQGANWPGSDKAATLFPARNSEPEITVTEIVLLGPVGF